jgi:hypothetical protein
MGILDDAIREHLDLQRRRGADPTEVERAEREALGPVRRNREAAEAPELEGDAAGETGFAYDQDGEDDWAYDPSDDDAPRATAVVDDPPPLEFVDDDLAEPEPPAAATAPPPAPERHEPAPPVRRIRPDDDLDNALGAHEPFPADRHAAAGGRAGDETAEYDVAEALDGDDKDEDVLEETPEFLQDTPEHDRLWFEQRPPRDFDFDS